MNSADIEPSIDSPYDQVFDSSSESSEDCEENVSVSDNINGAKPSSPKIPDQKKSDYVIPPPAPLFYERTDSESWTLSDDSDNLPRTGTSLALKHPPPQFIAPSSEDEPFANPIKFVPTDFENSLKTKNVSTTGYPEGLSGILVYDCFALNAQRRANRDESLLFHKISNEADTTLIFDSLFESGNLYQGLAAFMSEIVSH